MKFIDMIILVLNNLKNIFALFSVYNSSKYFKRLVTYYNRQISPDYPNTLVNICHKPHLSPDYPGGVKYLSTTPDGVVGK